MGRPGTGPRTTTAIRFSPELHARLDKEAARRDVSINQLVTRAAERALDRWEAQDLDQLLGAKSVLQVRIFQAEMRLLRALARQTETAPEDKAAPAGAQHRGGNHPTEGVNQNGSKQHTFTATRGSGPARTRRRR